MKSKSSLGLLALVALLWPAEPQSAYGASAFEQMLEQSKKEMSAKEGKLRIALDWTKGDVKGVLEEFTKQFDWIKDISYKRETGVDPFGRYLISIKQGDNPPYDILHVASEYQKTYWDAGVFIKPP